MAAKNPYQTGSERRMASLLIGDEASVRNKIKLFWKIKKNAIDLNSWKPNTWHLSLLSSVKAKMPTANQFQTEEQLTSVFLINISISGRLQVEIELFQLVIFGNENCLFIRLTRLMLELIQSQTKNRHGKVSWSWSWQLGWIKFPVMIVMIVYFGFSVACNFSALAIGFNSFNWVYFEVRSFNVRKIVSEKFKHFLIKLCSKSFNLSTWILYARRT